MSHRKRHQWIGVVAQLAQLATYAAATFFACSALATGIPNTSSNPKTFLGPTGRLSYTRATSDITAFSVLGEAGAKDFRLGGTVGWQATEYQTVKASAEWLRQKITYSFFSGRSSPWLDQGAVGLGYRYDFHQPSPYNTQLDVNAYYSHAPSRTLGVYTGNFISSSGLTESYVDARRIAGSNAAGISPGVTVTPWYGTHAGVALNYDNVTYDTVNTTSKNAKGFGGTAHLDQRIVDDVNLGLVAGVRAPYNNYEANVSWDNVHFHGTWRLSVFGEYTVGKNTLPTTYNAGVGADYFFDSYEKAAPPARAIPLPDYHPAPSYKDEAPHRVYKDEAPLLALPTEWEVNNTNKELLAFVGVPAVHMPTVLAVPDGHFSLSVCIPPTFTGLLGGIVGEFVGDISYSLSNNFSGTNLVYTINFMGQTDNGSIFVSNGVLTSVSADYPGGYADITVTASNICGSVTSNPFDAVP